MRKLGRCLLILLLFCNLALAKQSAFDPTKPEAKKFIQLMVKQYNYPKNKLIQLLTHTKLQQDSIDKNERPFEKKPWNFYRRFFLSAARIKHGARYWQHHTKTLQQTKKRYGVAPSVITAIIGVETFYGQHIGKYPVLDTLTTLGFNYPKRGKFYRNELKEYLLLTREKKLSPTSLVGSYSGALGIPQFMPSAYRYYAVKLNKTPRPLNLLTNHEDAIASVANYLKRYKFKQGQLVAVPAKITGKVNPKLLSTSGIPTRTIAQFAKLGVRPVKKVAPNKKAALIAMHNTDGDEYWLVFNNFRSIMRYNPSTTYALAVYQLSEAIKQAHEQELTAHKSSKASSARKA